MTPWLRIYRGRCLEVRVGAWRWQAGFTLPHPSFIVWRNVDYAPLVSWRWGRWLA